MATEWDDWIDEDEDLRISDLGDSFLQGEEPEELAQPGALLAPETILASSFDCRLDLWRAGITVFTFVWGFLPLYYLGDVNSLVAKIIGFVRKLPQEWQQNRDGMIVDSDRSGDAWMISCSFQSPDVSPNWTGLIARPK